jgi:hypothetical protein
VSSFVALSRRIELSSETESRRAAAPPRTPSTGKDPRALPGGANVWPDEDEDEDGGGGGGDREGRERHFNTPCTIRTVVWSIKRTYGFSTWRMESHL